MGRDERDGTATWECRECGAEIIEDTTLDAAPTPEPSA